MQSEIYNPEQWHDFFVVIGTSAATLTGLLFVAMSLHLQDVAHDNVQRHRALSILMSLAAAFMRCALVLMGSQNHLTVGFELFIVCGIVTVIGAQSYIRTIRSSNNIPRSSHRRSIGNISCHLIEMLGAAILMSGFILGLYIAAIAMVISFYYMISGSWLLLIGISWDENKAKKSRDQQKP